MDAITQFRGKYFFLSNFFSAPVYYRGIRFENNEAAFQAAKCPERMREFSTLAPRGAKRLGRQVKLRPDWETAKFNVMNQVCMAKFLQNPDLAWKLVETGTAELVEGNTWGDKLWGVCNGVGENHLGHILMDIRDDIRLFMRDPDCPLVDEVGGRHEGYFGWRPGGTPCGECSSLSCGSCSLYLSSPSRRKEQG